MKINLKMGTDKKPEIMDAIAPFSVYLSQNKDKIIAGQKVAAIPDQPNITNQKTVLFGDKRETTRAIERANVAKTNVVFFEKKIILKYL